MFIQALKLHESLNSRQKETSVKCVYEPGCRNNAAFKLAKTLQEKNRSTLTTNTIPRYKQDVVTIEDCVDSTEGTKYWIESLGLLRSDKEILRSKRSWLNSSIINASQHLLSRQFSISGFQSVGCAYTMSFAVQRSFIQIIHDQSRNHWLVISNSSDAATVNVYDSLFHELSPSSEQQIACIMNTQYNELKVDFIDVQCQSGPDDCGLFAIAFVVEFKLDLIINRFIILYCIYETMTITNYCINCHVCFKSFSGLDTIPIRVGARKTLSSTTVYGAGAMTRIRTWVFAVEIAMTSLWCYDQDSQVTVYGAMTRLFATTLCNGKQPESMFYDQQQMRSHLLSCFEKRILEQFPIVKKRRIRTKKIVNTQMIEIHCICRMPEISGLPMVSCSDCNTWYHGTICMKVEEEAWKPNTLWYCDNCRT